nr:uncharacterized protein LOC121502311 [Drosophila kikkawai]
MEAEDPVGRTTTGGDRQRLCCLAQEDGHQRDGIMDGLKNGAEMDRQHPPPNKADLSPESRWLSGPAFLRLPASSCPVPEEGTERGPDAPDDEEMPSEFALVATNEFVIPFQRFSSFSRLVRTTAWVLRFARWCRKQRSELKEYGLTAKECEAAENLLVRQAQLESFPDEMRSSKRGKEVASSSEIRGLAPYMDEHGVLRVYGRIDAALCMPYSARRPVILSHRHSLTEMKEVISSCNECKLQRTRPMPPIMAPLPEDQLEAGGWPFKYTGMDYIGPLLVTVARHREKRWVALFTCLTTRAIYLELAHDLSTDSAVVKRAFGPLFGPTCVGGVVKGNSI